MVKSGSGKCPQIATSWCLLWKTVSAKYFDHVKNPALERSIRHWSHALAAVYGKTQLLKTETVFIPDLVLSIV